MGLFISNFEKHNASAVNAAVERELNSKLVSEIKKGNALAFKDLFTTYCKPLTYFTRRLVKDHESAENIVQDIFLRVWQNKDNLDPSQNIKSFLFTSAKNHALNYIRHENVKHQSEDELKLLTQQILNPEEEIFYSELSRTYHEAVQRLPEKCRQIFSMNRFEQLSHREIADELNISKKTVENQMNKALKYLRKHLAKFLVVILSLPVIILIIIWG